MYLGQCKKRFKVEDMCEMEKCSILVRNTFVMIDYETLEKEWI